MINIHQDILDPNVPKHLRVCAIRSGFLRIEALRRHPRLRCLLDHGRVLVILDSTLPPTEIVLICKRAGEP